MTAGPWQITDTGLKKLIDGTFDVDSDSFMSALLSSVSNISLASTAWAGVTGELATANGYTAGGKAAALQITGTSPYAVSFVSNVEWEAVGGDISARWQVIFEAGGDVLAFVLLEAGPPAADKTATPANKIGANSDGTTSSIFTLTAS